MYIKNKGAPSPYHKSQITVSLDLSKRHNFCYHQNMDPYRHQHLLQPPPQALYIHLTGSMTIAGTSLQNRCPPLLLSPSFISHQSPHTTFPQTFPLTPPPTQRPCYWAATLVRAFGQPEISSCEAPGLGARMMQPWPWH